MDCGRCRVVNLSVTIYRRFVTVVGKECMMLRHEWVAKGWVVGMLSLIGCQSPVDVPPAVVGTIIQVQTDPFRILIEEDGPEPCGYWFAVDSRTIVRVSVSTGATSRAGASDLRVGVRVSAWADGEMLLSCPASGRAAKVLINP